MPIEFEERLLQAVSIIRQEDRAFLLKVLSSSDERRAEVIGNVHVTGLAPATVELLIDLEEDAAARALVVGMLREGP